MTKQAKKERKAAYMREWRKTHFLTGEAKRKDITRSYLNVYVRLGQVKKTICFCGATKVEAHHADYSKPLEVVWICRKHHLKLHKREREKVPRETITA